MKNKKNKYSFGAGLKKFLQTTAPIATMINPAIGAGMAAGASFLPSDEQQMPEATYKTLEKGGSLEGFKQYNAPSHAQGGQTINNEGDLDMAGQNEIEKKENKITYFNLPDKAGEKYIFSDKLGTASKMKEIVNKYSKRKLITDTDRNGIEFEAKLLESENEAKKVQKINKETNEFFLGGELDPLPMKDTPLDPTLAQNIASQFKPAGVTTDPIEKLPGAGSTQNKAQEITSKFKPVLNDSKTKEEIKLNIDVDSILRGGAYATKALSAFGKADKDKVILPDYSKSDAKMNKLNANLTQSKQDVQAASNVMSNINRNSASSFNTFRNRQTQNIANMQNQLGKINLQEQGLKNNISSQQAQYETNKAQNIRNIKDDVQVRNLQNKARQEDLRNSFADSMLGEADRLSMTKNAKELAQMTNQEILSIAQTIQPDFEANADFYDNLKKYASGEIKWDDLSPQERAVIKYKK